MDAKLITEYIGHKRGRARYKVIKPFVVEVPIEGGGIIRIVVPTDFITDFASTPWLLWAILPPTGPYMEDALVHDFLYSTNCPRFLADAIFRVLMNRRGIELWKRVPMFYTVRVFGGLARRRAKA